MFVTIPINQIVIVSFLLLLKHWLADWELQTTWMVHGKRRGGFRFLLPLFVHAGIHGILVFYVISAYFLLVYHTVPVAFILISTGTDFASHFVIDRTKALLERFDSRNHKYMVELTGLDQLFHFSVYLILVYMVIYRT
jgi:hypothetical protein